jgi:hypothetical protein
MSAPANRDKSPVRDRRREDIADEAFNKIMAYEDTEMKLLSKMRSAYSYRRSAIKKILDDIVSAINDGDTDIHKKEMFSEHFISKKDAYIVVGAVESVLDELKFQKYNFIIGDTYLTYDVIAPK